MDKELISKIEDIRKYLNKKYGVTTYSSEIHINSAMSGYENKITIEFEDFGNNVSKVEKGTLHIKR